ncbi:hypothetical protein OIO90_002791 [Microbotryomycetes sp. JL221]|nr:hypothetical protein OIO90_002791 [Microbotryomycetes sp. JL221]
MNSTATDTYWHGADDDLGDGLAALRGYSPAPTLLGTGASGGGLMRSGSTDNAATSGTTSTNVNASSTTSMTYGLSPSAFDPNSFSSQFMMPRFATGGPGDAFGYPGVAVAQGGGTLYDNLKPAGFGPSPVTTPSSMFNFTTMGAPQQTQPQQQSQQQKQQQRAQGNTNASTIASTSSQPFSRLSAPVDAAQQNQANVNAFQMQQSDPTLSTGPIYAPYGSSVISINSQGSNGFKIPPLGISLPPTQPATQTFNPSAMGLPAPPSNGSGNNFAGLYSSSGFDMLGVLARVAARPNPQLQIGAVDTSCAFLVVDARKWDQPIVFASDTFTRMTGYRSEEIIGRNCRFLQSPDGITQQGVPRKYTDSNAAWHMRTHIAAGKESQSSLINYKKDGKPFINLVTIVPITWDTDEIAYFVGFQVDLVEQPNAILDRMKDGTYVINYTLTAQVAPAPSTTVNMQNIEAEAGDNVPAWDADKAVVLPGSMQGQSNNATQAYSTMQNINGGSSYINNAVLVADQSQYSESQALDLVSTQGVDALETEADKRVFHKFLLGQASDFVHVLSLKGSFLYCSPSCASVLEYQPHELIGKTLPTLCHPSDVVPVMRLLKDCSTPSNPTVSLLYRIRRKHSGYVWLESSGKLHIEPGKGRKCVVFVGRPREVFKMSWNDIRQGGGVGDTEFWMNMSGRGAVLAATAAIESVLGHSQNDIVGENLFSLALPEFHDSVRQALEQCVNGTASAVRYKIKSKIGFSDVVTRFYPRRVDEADDLGQPVGAGPFHVQLLAQTNEFISEQRKMNGGFATQAPVYPFLIARSPSADSASTGGDSNKSTVWQSTYKTLAHPSALSDNVFDELESRRPTSWQFELHQLQNTNRKLREEKDHLLALGRKRGHGSIDNMSLATSSRKKRGSSDGGSTRSTKSNGGRGCANCGKMDSPEWRAGPTGQKTLCNACGLRWAKSQRQASEAAAPASGAQQSPPSTSSAGVSPAEFAQYQPMETSDVGTW